MKFEFFLNQTLYHPNRGWQYPCRVVHRGVQASSSQGSFAAISDRRTAEPLHTNALLKEVYTTGYSEQNERHPPPIPLAFIISASLAHTTAPCRNRSDTPRCLRSVTPGKPTPPAGYCSRLTVDHANARCSRLEGVASGGPMPSPYRLKGPVGGIWVSAAPGCRPHTVRSIRGWKVFFRRHHPFQSSPESIFRSCRVLGCRNMSTTPARRVWKIVFGDAGADSGPPFLQHLPVSVKTRQKGCTPCF